MESPELEKLVDLLPSDFKVFEIRSTNITTLLRACDPADSVSCYKEYQW